MESQQPEDEVIISGTSNFSLVKRKVNGKDKSIIKYSGELYFDDLSAVSLVDCISQVLEHVKRRS
jgi:hypothetical protein